MISDERRRLGKDLQVRRFYRTELYIISLIQERTVQVRILKKEIWFGGTSNDD
jgi:hypothetical protein